MIIVCFATHLINLTLLFVDITSLVSRSGRLVLLMFSHRLFKQCRIVIYSVVSVHTMTQQK